MINNYFFDDYLLSVHLDWNSMEATRGSLDTFCSAFGAMVGERNKLLVDWP